MVERTKTNKNNHLRNYMKKAQVLVLNRSWLN